MRKLTYIFALCLVSVFFACSEDAPDGLLSESDMEDILYDMHVAQCLSGYGGSMRLNDINKIAYRKSVLKKYDVTEAEWDSSFNYYCRHADDLYDIYQDITERMQNELLAEGGDLTMLSGNIAESDTTNIWGQESNFIMMHLVPYNTRTFTIPADTSYHAGDKFTLDYDMQFVFQDGMRDVVVVLAITLKNDSVVSQIAHSSSDGHGNVTVSDEYRKGIKSVQGYFFVSQGLDDNNALSTLRLVSVKNVRLVRMHTDTKDYEQRMRNDSIQRIKNDSIRNAEAETPDNQPNNEQIHDEKNPVAPPERMPMPVRTR